MKHKLVCAVVALTLLVPTLALAGPLFFSVSPGQTLQGFQFGKAFGRFEPYVGFDLMSASGKVAVDDTTATIELSAGATLLIPNIGVRACFPTQELKPYAYVGFLKSFASVNAKVKSGFLAAEFEGNTKDQLTSLLGFWGINAGFGVEYPFSEHFGVGGEYGFRYLHAHSEGEGDENSLLLSEGMTDKITATLKQSTARIVLDYRF